MIDKDFSQTPIKSLCPPFLSFFAQIYNLVVDDFYNGTAFHLLTNVFDFFMYLAAALYDIFGLFRYKHRNTAS